MTGLATRAIHAVCRFCSRPLTAPPSARLTRSRPVAIFAQASHIPAGREVAPSITVSTTFRNLSPAELVAAGGEKAWDAADPNHDLVYSRSVAASLRTHKALS